MAPEQKAIVSIDTLLVAADWYICNVTDAGLQAAFGVAIHELPLSHCFGFAD